MQSNHKLFTRPRLIGAGVIAVAVIGISLVAGHSVSAKAQQAELAYLGGGSGFGAECAHKGHGRAHRGMRAERMAMIMDKADSNGDEALTQEELTTYMDQQVADADENGDGQLSVAEFQKIWLAHNQHIIVRAFQKLDRDADGAVVAEERSRILDRMFDRIDRNGDGQIDSNDRKRMRGDG